MTEQLCPVCGSPGIKDEQKTIVLEEPFGGQAIVDTHENVCPICGARGDLFDQNEEVIDNTYKALKQKSIENILNDFTEHKISMSGIERALGLPQRTLSKWKNGNAAPSATGLALMRFVRLFPWMLVVAEEKYDFNEAQKIHIQDAVNQLLSVVSFDERDIFNYVGISTAWDTATIFVTGKKGAEIPQFPIDVSSKAEFDYVEG